VACKWGGTRFLAPFRFFAHGGEEHRFYVKEWGTGFFVRQRVRDLIFNDESRTRSPGPKMVCNTEMRIPIQ
jgi:hypothetical protein